MFFFFLLPSTSQLYKTWQILSSIFNRFLFSIFNLLFDLIFRNRQQNTFREFLKVKHKRLLHTFFFCVIQKKKTSFHLSKTIPNFFQRLFFSELFFSFPLLCLQILVQIFHFFFFQKFAHLFWIKNYWQYVKERPKSKQVKKNVDKHLNK